MVDRGGYGEGLKKWTLFHSHKLRWGSGYDCSDEEDVFNDRARGVESQGVVSQDVGW